MAKPIELGIGFLTGRTNICNIINNCYKDMIEQLKRYPEEVNLTIFILYDLAYQQTKREDFYTIKDDVYKKINIKYITPENIDEEKKILKSRYNLTRKRSKFNIRNRLCKSKKCNYVFCIKKKNGLPIILG